MSRDFTNLVDLFVLRKKDPDGIKNEHTEKIFESSRDNCRRKKLM